MSKKIFLRTYADAVKAGLQPVSTAEDHLEGVEGESIIKPEWVGFRYSNREKSPIIIESDTDVDSPSKPLPEINIKIKPSSAGKRKIQFHLHHSMLADPIVLLSDTSDDTCSPVKTRKKSSVRSLDLSSSSESLPDLSNIITASSETGKDEASDEFASYYEDNTNLPIYKKLTSGIKTKVAVELLLRKFPENNVCSDIPSSINDNISFVYSVNKLGHWKNALCDGMGRWDQKGTEHHYFNVADDTDANSHVSSVTQSCVGDGSLRVTRRKYVNASNNSLHRVIITLENAKEESLLDQFFVQYFYDGEPPEDVKVNRHRNSKQNKNAYKRTSDTTKERIKELCKNSKPKDTFHSIMEEQGGLLNVSSAAYLAKDRMQISNFGRTLKKLSDPILDCVDLAREQADKNEKFVRDVQASPEFAMFLSSKKQLWDARKFCTQNKNFSILGVDTTFNIGQYFITATTFRHLMLENRFGVEPVMLGPVLLHQKKSFESYFKLPSDMIRACKELKDVKVFGTDGDVVLSSAFQVNFPEAKHIMCDIHMFDNIQRKLRELGVQEKEQKQYISDIFGSVVEQNKKVPGLVDCFSTTEFESKISDLKEIWIQHHAAGLQFFDYFIDYKADYIKHCMSADLRSLCGLGFPPKPYTQNANECINSVIKKSVLKQKGCKLNAHQFAKEIEAMVKRQEAEVELSLINKGEYRLKPEYQHLCIDEDEFFRKSTTQRASVLKRLQDEPLKPRRTVPSPEQPQAMMATDTIGGDDDHNSLQNMSVSAEESSIINVPFSLLNELFLSADVLLDKKDNIIKVPGCSENIYFVANENTPSSPLKVRYARSSGQCTCDKKCARYNSLKICQHTLALAEHKKSLNKYLTLFKRISASPNLTKASTCNLPANRGKKPNQATSRRKGRANATRSELLGYAESRSLLHDEQLFHLTFMAGIIRKCCGCGNAFAEKYRYPPNDLILKTYDYRSWRDPSTKEMRTSRERENMYFHLKADCARKMYPTFEMTNVLIHNEIKRQLLPSHLQLLTTLHVTV